MRITVYGVGGAAATVNLPPDGILSRRTRERVQRKLRTPPGLPDSGPLGEVGPQRPPETPGWEYTFAALPGGGVEATPRLVADSGAEVQR